NLPISIKSSWRVGPNSHGSGEELVLDLEITNHSKKTIKNIGAFYIVQRYDLNNIPFKDRLSSTDLLKSPNSNLSISIRGGQTVSVSCNLLGLGYTASGITYEVDFYISCIRYTWFGGLWGKLPNVRIDWSNMDTIFEDLDLTKLGVKIDIEPYIYQ
ncbi:MAG: hypothetical protein FWF37_04420, partial [Chloroflexi bacterium]|nr:hypothetical protein [Chloroflexota bacterium]